MTSMMGSRDGCTEQFHCRACDGSFNLTTGKNGRVTHDAGPKWCFEGTSWGFPKSRHCLMPLRDCLSALLEHLPNTGNSYKYITNKLFAHTVHPYSRLKTDTFLLQLQLASLQGIAKEDGVEVLGITCDTPFVMGLWSETAGSKCLPAVRTKTQEANVGTTDSGKFFDAWDF